MDGLFKQFEKKLKEEFPSKMSDVLLKDQDFFWKLLFEVHEKYPDAGLLFSLCLLLKKMPDELDNFKF